MKLTIAILIGCAIGYLGSIYTSEVFVGIICLAAGYAAAKTKTDFITDDNFKYR